MFSSVTHTGDHFIPRALAPPRSTSCDKHSCQANAETWRCQSIDGSKCLKEADVFLHVFTMNYGDYCRTTKSLNRES